MPPASNIKLIYLDMQGRAEFTRILLAQAGIPYEDKRLSKEEWEKMKPGERWTFSPFIPSKLYSDS